MTTTLTRVPTGETLPLLLVTNVGFAAEVPTVVHRVIGRSTPDFTVHPTGPRTGTYELLCVDETAALDLYELLRTSGPFTITDTDTAVANAKFLVTGRLWLQVDPVTQKTCLVTVDYTETP